jgi:SAM-dependent methyltransferase
MKLIKSITKCYTQLSNIGKILVFISILLFVVIFFKSIQKQKEGMENNANNEPFLFKQNVEVYDDFYANIYDYLVFNSVKNDYEIGTIQNSTQLTEKSVIADVGCGTGHHVAEMRKNNLNVVGIDISPSMIQKAKQEYPEYANYFRVGNVLNNSLFRDNSLTHLLCLYFTVYYLENKMLFFNHVMNWLMPGGYFIVHLVDKHTFDPILPPGNPLYIVSPQKYAKERITHTKITFNDFVYKSNFQLRGENKASFEETFKFNNGNVRKQEQTLHMEDLTTTVNMILDAGFILHSKVNMVKCAYENQYLYIFTKPN